MQRFEKREQTSPTNGMEVIGPSHSVDITRCICTHTPAPASQPLILAVSSVLLALHHKMTGCPPPNLSKPKRSQTNTHSFHGIRDNLMTRPLKFSLLYDKNRLFGAKRIACRNAIFPYSHRTNERTNERTDIAAC